MVTVGGRPWAVVDASVLINFLRVDRLGLLAGSSAWQFHIVDDVRVEITEPDQANTVDLAIAAGLLQPLSLVDVAELSVYARLSRTAGGGLGRGEAASITVAGERRLVLAIDDRKARRMARTLYPGVRLIDTADIVVAAIRAQFIPVAEADNLKHEWATRHGFKLPFDSFADRLNSP